MRLLDENVDPLVRTNFLTQLASLQIARARYSIANDLVSRAEHISIDYRLDFAAVLCRCVRAHSEIGLRRLRDARATLGQLAEELSAIDDPYFHFAHAALEARLALTAGIPQEVPRLDPLSFESLPPRGVMAEMHAMTALADVSLGD
jgi:hypothetical protein